MREIREDEQSNPVYEKRNSQAREQQRPLENQPRQMAECNEQEDEDGEQGKCLVRHDGSLLCRKSWRLVVVAGGLLEFGVGEEVVLDPKLRAGLFQEGINGHARGTGLGGIEFEGWHAIERTLLGIMIEIAGKQNGPGLGQFHV